MLDFILLGIAFVCFVLYAVDVKVPNVVIMGVGLAAWVLVPLIDAAKNLR